MQDAPSRTAEVVANALAYHQVADEPRIFTDPFALDFYGKPPSPVTEFDEGLDPELARGRRLFMVARRRAAFEAIAAAIAAGTDQAMVLGAGSDTTACRLAGRTVRIVEVDHPVTQTRKLDRLAQAGIKIPAGVIFVPADFESSTLAAALELGGLDRARSVVISWCGVIPYLTEKAVDRTLELIAGHGGEVRLVLDYFRPIPSTPSDPAAAQLRERAARAAAAGEPWRTFFIEDEIRRKLESFGFEVEDWSAARLLAGYGIETNQPPTDSGPHLIHAVKA